MNGSKNTSNGSPLNYPFSSPFSSPPNFSLGIIGGGQLAYFLATAAKKLSINPFVIAQHQEDPALRVSKKHFIGSFQEFLQTHPPTAKSTWTFENEFLNTDSLNIKNLEFFPSLHCIHLLKNKLHQKNLLKQLSIPTSPWIEKKDSESAKEFLKQVQKSFAQDWVLKWATGGYDGKGTYLHSSSKNKALIEAESFIQQTKSEIYAESKINFSHECAIVACRDQHQTIITYPLVISQQENGICRYVQGPASALGLHEKQESEAAATIKKILEHLDYVGCLAVEFFVNSNGELLVNEIAPRVHNTAHYSIDASSCSQFENHVRCVAGLKAAPPTHSNFFAMFNLLGPKSLKTPYWLDSMDSIFDSHLIKAPLTLHWYFKTHIKAGRKLGHINLVAQNLKEFESGFMEMQKIIIEIEAKLLHKGST